MQLLWPWMIPRLKWFMNSRKAASVSLVLFQPKWWERGSSSSRDAACHQDDRSHRSKVRKEERKGGLMKRWEVLSIQHSQKPLLLFHANMWKYGKDNREKREDREWKRKLGIHYVCEVCSGKALQFRQNGRRIVCNVINETWGRKKNYCCISNSSKVGPFFSHLSCTLTSLKPLVLLHQVTYSVCTCCICV